MECDVEGHWKGGGGEHLHLIFISPSRRWHLYLVRTLSVFSDTGRALAQEPHGLPVAFALKG